MPDFAVNTAFNARDKISPAFTKMGKNADKFGRHGAKAFRKMGKSADKFGHHGANAFRKVTGAGYKFRGIVRSILPVISAAAILRFADESIEKYKLQEVAIKNVEAGLKSTNNAIGISSKQLQKMAMNWQNVGIFGDEDILQNVTAQLLTFGSIGKQNFDRMQGAAMDLTAKLYGTKATGEQLRDITVMLGKAMDDPIKGMTALRRRGIQFNDEQKREIQLIQIKQGKNAAQAKLLQEIEALYGGVNKELRKTNFGMERAAKMKLGDAMEKVGKQLIPLKIELLKLAIYILPKITHFLPKIISFFKMVGPIILIAAGAFVAYSLALKTVAAYQAIMAATGIIKGFMLITKATNFATAAQWLWNIAMSANPIGVIIIALAALATTIYLVYNNWELARRKFLEWTKIWDHPIFGTIASILMPFVSFPITIARNFDYLKSKIIEFGGISMNIFKSVGGIIMTALLAPVNFLISGIIKLLQIASSIPGIGDKFKFAAEQVQRFQDRANNAVGAQNLIAPNKSEIESQQIRLQGEINFNNAPSGTTVKSKTRGAPPIKLNLIGAN